jgi:integrase
MRWGKNLRQTPEGLWEVIFRGEELKVAQRGHKTNEYRCTYSPEVSVRIDDWRAFLQERLGKDFERRCPYVFASSDLTPEAISYQAFKTNIEQLVLELRGLRFTPHKARHIVGTFLVNDYGAGGLGLAVELLGDTPEVILRTYYRPNNEEARQGYLAMRKRA